jgi:hypothetical protein
MLIIVSTEIVTKGLKGICKQYQEIIHDKESATIWNLKPDWWGVPLDQGEKYQGKGNLS